MLMLDRINLAQKGALKCGMKEPLLIIGPEAAEDLRKELVERLGVFIPKGTLPNVLFGMKVVGNINKGDKFDVVEGKKESTCS